MSNETKQTAVEWYAEKSIILFGNLRIGKITFETWFKQNALLLEQAKQMDKEQIENAFEQGENNSVDYFNPENRIKES
jgi:hypothetical protein